MKTTDLAGRRMGAVLEHVRHLVNRHGTDQLTDRQLLERFLTDHDEAAFAALVRRHGPMVLGVCRRVLHRDHDAEDVFQATFLILAHKAASIRKRASVGSWLYGVAQRLAVRAKVSAAQRRAQERRRTNMAPADPMAEMTWNELRSVLDEELQRLPDKFGTALVLCYLQGKTHDEAARHLGWSRATLRRRLGQGREMLRLRLVRRGMTLSAALFASLLGESVAQAVVPGRLVYATVQAATGLAAGKTAAAVVSAPVAALVEGGLKAMVTAKLKIATALILAFGTVGLGATGLMRHVLAGPPPTQECVDHSLLSGASAASEPRGGGGRSASPDKAKQKPTAAPQHPAGPRSSDEITVVGRVLGVDGKPVAGAKLLLFGKGDKSVGLGSTAANGRFTVAVPKDLKGLYLVARLDGAGIDFIYLERLQPADPIELRVVKDQAIRGRIVDTQGKPVAGVQVTADDLNVYANNSLDAFLVEWKKRHFMSGIPSGVKSLWGGLGPMFTTTTDAKGQFTLAGAGVERLVGLRLSGAGIADAQARVVNRARFDPKPYDEATVNNIPKGMENLGFRRLLHGPDFSLVAEAEKPIRGVVKEADTGKGRPGVEVSLTRSGDDLLPILPKAKTDADGRYEIHGARKAKSYMLEVLGDPAAGYVACQVRAADTPGYQPVTADIHVAKGVIITGQVIDKTTGKPVPGFAMAGVLSDNPFVKDYPEFTSSAWLGTQETADDGAFRIVTIPGPVLLMGGPDVRRLAGGRLEEMKYKPAVPDPKYPQYFNNTGDAILYYTLGGARSHVQGNFCKVLEIKPDTAIVHKDIVLEQASAIPVKIQDAEDRPLTGVWVTGISPRNFEPPILIEKDTCSAYDVEGSKPRLMVFFEPSKNLIGTLTLKGDEKGPVVAKLRPSGGVKGRLVVEDGKPLSGFVIEVHYSTRQAQEIYEHMHRATPRVVTDSNGAFQVDGLIPGLEFKLDHHRASQAPLRANPLAEKLTVRSAEALDLGDLRAKPVPEGDEE